MRINLNHQATPIREAIERSRRSFLATSASGIGHVALASLLLRDGVLAAGGDLRRETGDQGSTRGRPRSLQRRNRAFFSLWRVHRANWICSIPSRSSTNCTVSRSPSR